MAGRSRTASAVAAALAFATVLAASSVSDAAVTTARRPAGTALFGSVLRSRSGPERIKAPIAGLTVPSRGAVSILSSVKTFKNRYLFKTGAPKAVGSRVDEPRSAGVAIRGTYDVRGMPRTPAEFVIVVACQGATRFSFFCGTQAHPAWEAFAQPKRGSVSEGTYNFGRIPVSRLGWRGGLILLDGPSNSGYYPSSSGALVAARGSRKSVVRAIFMRFVIPEILATLHVPGTPRGYHFQFAAIVCPSSVTPDQLGIFEQSGTCGIAEGFDTREIGIYATPGKWTVRYIFAPYKGNVLMFAPQDIITNNFSITGPKVALNTLSSRVVVNVLGKYTKPSLSGSVNAQALDQSFFADLFIVDVATNTAVVGLFVDPFSSTTRFQVFLDAGTYATYAEVLPPFSQDQYAQVLASQVVLTQLGSNYNVGLAIPTMAVNYAIQPVSATITGNISIAGLSDLANATGWDNVQPFSFLQICPAATFSLECSGGFVVSPSDLLGGSFTLYDITSVVSMAFVYTDLAGNVVIGPSVTSAASSSLRHVSLTAPYQAPTFWGDVTVSGDNHFEIYSLWIQACPAAKAFSTSCASGVSQSVNNFANFFPPQKGSFKVGYAIDLPSGKWRIAAVGSTFYSGVARQLGSAVAVDVATTYPVVNLTAKG